MNIFLRIFALALALLMAAGCAFAEDDATDSVIALVNGQPLYESDYNEAASIYLSSAAQTDDESLKAYIEDLALTAAIEELLVQQDMQAQGCYDFDESIEAWLAEQGAAAYEAALADVGEALRAALDLTGDEDLTTYALAYAEALGVTEQNYIDVCREQYAYVNYYAWLLRDDPITDEAVEASYEERVAASQALYENDAAAFETALSSDEEVWYRPDGYRSILQILLPAEGDTDEAKLASVQDTVEEINARLEAGEAFETLIAEYGIDSAFDQESFYTTGYQVHKDSVLWEDAFVDAAFEMAQPGDWSQPFASDLGVHILYYLGDVAGGPVELSDTLRNVLSYQLYIERCQTLLNARIDELADSAEVILY